MRNDMTETDTTVKRPEGDALAIGRLGELEEHVHFGHAAVVDADGRLLAWAGDPGCLTVLHAAADPVMAVPVLLGGVKESSGLGETDTALLLSSDSDAPERVAGLTRLMAATGVREDELALPPRPPGADDADAGEEAEGASRLRHSSAGKHIGALALCKRQKLPLAGYTRPDHPVQREMLRRIAEFAGVGEGAVGRAKGDCGLPVYGLPLWRLALVYARLAAPPADWADEGVRGAAAAVADAMTNRPDLVARSGSLAGTLLEHGSAAKSGGASVLAFALPDLRLGVAIRMTGDSGAALPVVAAAMLDDIAAAHPSGRLAAGAAQRVRERLPAVRLGSGGEPIGGIEPAARLVFADGLRI